MLSAKSTTPKKINILGVIQLSFSLILINSVSPASAQDNSPYTRYGLGDIVPSTNIVSRGMGSISAGYADFFTINYNNPASYGSFQAARELKSKKMAYGRAILDIGLNFENRTLSDPDVTEKFTASNALFSHIQVGVPLRPNWGLSFGLRPINRISYNIARREKLIDPNTGQGIDTAITQNQGDGGAYLASAGLGHRFNLGSKSSLSFGVNAGYFFGKKDYSARRSILNDSLLYNSGNFQTKTTYGNVYFNGGLQYSFRIDSATFVTFGFYGNLKQTLNASQDIVRETFYYDPSSGNRRLDSVYESRNNRGKIEYPSSFTGGFVIQRVPRQRAGGWLFGVDFHQANWDNYRFYGMRDSVRNKWELRAGGELRPSLSAGRKSYFGNVTYRAGFFFGPDYIQVQEKLPTWGASFGLGLPILSQNRFSPGQATFINLSFEYIKRGDDKNILQENMFRVSAGFSLSDFWFVRKKYE